MEKDKEAVKRVTKQILHITISIFKLTFKLIITFCNSFFKELSKRFRFSISFKMTVVYTFIFSIILLIIYASVLMGFGAYLVTSSDNSMHKQAKIIEDMLKDKNSIPEKALKSIARNNDMDIYLFTADRTLLYNSGKRKNIAFSNFPKKKYINFNNANQIIVNVKIDPPAHIRYIQLARYFKNEEAYLAVVAIVFILLILIAIIITAIIGWRTSKKMLLPVKRMTETVKDISISALHTRLDVGESHDELKDLAETFNNMIYRIQKSYEQQNQFVSDASHELRTPISVIQGYANLLQRWGKNNPEILDESIAAIKSESENMKDLIEKLLFLARSDKNTQKIELEHFWLNELIDEIIKETRLIDAKHNIFCDMNENVMITADRKLMKEALRIFIDNSIKYTEESGTIILNSSIRNSHILITIEDTGAGIPPEDIPFIFNRFYRSDKSRTKKSGGNGLGLSIAKWIIERHHGKITVESTINIGTKISIVLPCT